MRVAVTGASGLVGSHVVRELLASGHEPVAFSRSVDKLAAAARMHGTETVLQVAGDVTDRDSVRGLLRSVDAVVHAAAMAETKGVSAAAQHAVNVDGTRVVIEEAVAAGLASIQHVSSVSVFFPTPNDVMTVDDPFTRVSSPYAQSKLAAEKLARTAQGNGHPVVIVYPGGVFGPDEPQRTEFTNGNILMVSKGGFVFPKGGGNVVIDVRDLAIVLAAALDPSHAGQRFMAGGQFASWDEWVSLVAAAANTRIRSASIEPKWMLRGGRALDALSKRFDGFDPPIGAQAVEFMSWTRPTDDSLVRERLGVTYRPLKESVADYVAWMKRTSAI